MKLSQLFGRLIDVIGLRKKADSINDTQYRLLFYFEQYKGNDIGDAAYDLDIPLQEAAKECKWLIKMGMITRLRIGESLN